MQLIEAVVASPAAVLLVILAVGASVGHEIVSNSARFSAIIATSRFLVAYRVLTVAFWAIVLTRLAVVFG